MKTTPNTQTPATIVPAPARLVKVHPVLVHNAQTLPSRPIGKHDKSYWERYRPVWVGYVKRTRPASRPADAMPDYLYSIASRVVKTALNYVLPRTDGNALTRLLSMRDSCSRASRYLAGIASTGDGDTLPEAITDLIQEAVCALAPYIEPGMDERAFRASINSGLHTQATPAPVTDRKGRIYDRKGLLLTPRIIAMRAVQRAINGQRSHGHEVGKDDDTLVLHHRPARPVDIVGRLALRAFVKSLPPVDRAIVVMVAHGWTYARIASKLRVTVSAVSNRVSRNIRPAWVRFKATTPATTTPAITPERVRVELPTPRRKGEPSMFDGMPANDFPAPIVRMDTPAPRSYAPPVDVLPPHILDYIRELAKAFTDNAPLPRSWWDYYTVLVSLYLQGGRVAHMAQLGADRIISAVRSASRLSRRYHTFSAGEMYNLFLNLTTIES